MTKVVPITAFACSICQRVWDTPAEAIKCYDSHQQPNYVSMTHICEGCKEECNGDSCALKQRAK